MEHRAVDLNEDTVKAALSGLPLGGLRVFRSIGSTNDEALAWATHGAPDLALVVADEQTSGRGRAGRAWSTPPGKALAISLVLGAENAEMATGRLAGLGALAVAEACDALGASAEIKWPNDVLVRRKKIAGILAEAIWNGDRLDAAVLGIGMNVLRGSAPPTDSGLYPAISLEEALERVPERGAVLRLVIAALLDWGPRLSSDDFIRAWENRLAFRGQEVVLSGAGQSEVTGTLLGLADDGGLRILVGGEPIQVTMGELHLRAADDRMR